jgi:hypothetical protein
MTHPIAMTFRMKLRVEPFLFKADSLFSNSEITAWITDITVSVEEQ